jgi:hypothetical protein
MKIKRFIAPFITLPYGERLLKRALFPSKRLRIGICDCLLARGPGQNLDRIAHLLRYS